MITNEQCEAFIETFRANEWRGELEAIRLGLEAARIQPAQEKKQ